MCNRISLLSVDEAREKEGILDEKDGGVVANQVPDTVLGVEFDGETAGIPAMRAKQRIIEGRTDRYRCYLKCVFHGDKCFVPSLVFQYRRDQ